MSNNIINNNNNKNLIQNNENELEDVIMQNMIEEFMNISDEDNKIFNLLKEEFKELKFLHYGSLMFIQNDLNLENFPNISELLQIYEEIFGNLTMKNSLNLKFEKYYIIYNDGFVCIGSNGMGKKIHVYKIKTLVIILLINDLNKCGFYNKKILKVLKQIKFV